MRAVAAELNERVLSWRRIPLGPPVFVPVVDTEALAARWREAHPAEPAPPSAPARRRGIFRRFVLP